MKARRLKSLSGIIAPLLVIAGQVLYPVVGRTSSKEPAKALMGFSRSSSQTEIEWEQKMRAVPKPELLREYMKRLSAKPHHVGSDYDRNNAEWILSKFKEWGLDAHIENFDVLFPTPTERVLDRKSTRLNSSHRL